MREASFMPDRTAGLMLSQVKTLKACDLKGCRVENQFARLAQQRRFQHYVSEEQKC